MPVNMPRSVVIIHSSEVVRKGLLHVLEGELRCSVRCFETTGDFLINLPDTSQEIAFILPAGFSDFQILLKTAKREKYRFCLIGIEPCVEGTVKEPFDFIFHLNQSSRFLLNPIKSFFEEQKDEPNDDELTVREKEVLRLIALGHTNKSIADTLFISTHTVISHRKNITEKLGIKSIPGLTVYAIVQKLISQDDIIREDR